jgi:hypothetical protein
MAIGGPKTSASLSGIDGMTSAVCTLFEGDYHYGVGALTNSLYSCGFRGTIYAGYRGALPPWINGAKEFEGFTEYCAGENMTLRFMPLATKSHLTNHKPDFMLALWEKHCVQADALFYFDPDIVVKCDWAFFEKWVEAGIAVCADMNSSMSPNHPTRHAWMKFYAPYGLTVRQRLDMYFNGGFIGLRREEQPFLHQWQHIQEWMAPEIGGLQNVNVGEGTRLFHKTDQDALNIACMAGDCPISPFGQDGMDFQQGGGGYIMSHAIGNPKPWRKPFVRTVILRGVAPSRADRQYFNHVQYPIKLWSSTKLACRRIDLKLACALGRFARS